MKLNPRERLLAFIVGGAVLLLLNMALLSAFSRRNILLRTELGDRRQELTQINQLLSEKTLWATRDAALTAKQPKITNDNAAGVELLEKIRAVAKSHNISLENEQIPGVEKTSTTWYHSVPVTLDAHSSWSDLIAFLYAVQRPDQFIVCESANIQLDPGDQTKMLGHFKIARWYAP